MSSFDACIVGSGAGGGAAAYALTKAGFRVLLLEKGPHYQRTDFFHDELTVCRRDYFVPNPISDPHTMVREGKNAERTSDGWIACCVGGGTVAMSGFFFRMHREDFQLRSLYGDVPGAEVADWPLDFAEMEPFYEQAERVIGVSGDAKGNPAEPRRAPYPLAPVLSHPAAGLVDAACKKIGLKAFATPRAIISADYGGRSACQYCGFCGSYGCEVGAKSSSLATFLALADATGKLTLRPRMTVSEVTTNSAGHANGVVYLDEAGAFHRVDARVVVLACSAVETARLMLLSQSAQHPDGLANGSGLVGKNLMFSTTAAGWARFTRPSAHFPPSARGLMFLDRTVQDFYVLPRAGLAHPKGGTLLFTLPHLNPIFQTERLAAVSDKPPLFGAELKRKMREFFHETHTIEWQSYSESLPHEACEVTVDPEVKDHFDRPVARIRLGLHATSLQVSDYLAERAQTILHTAGARELGLHADERADMFLQAGTARMGTDPNQSVLDKSCEAHEVKNLFVADSSSFPSSGGAPFALTIMANALRIGSVIAHRGRTSDL